MSKKAKRRTPKTVPVKPTVPRSEGFSIFSDARIQLLVLVAATILAYAHTLDVPFYLDDFSSIRENPAIWHLGNLSAIWHIAPMRVLGYLSFAVNYALGKFAVAGYHMVNIAIHIMAGLCVYALARGLRRTPALSGVSLAWFPFFTAALFLLHPLQTQAVTYIVQRLASMAALFYIGAMACYVQARLAVQKRARLVWAAGVLVLMAAAFFTKQNTLTLPAALWLVEAVFFNTSARRLGLAAAAAVLALAASWAAMAFLFGRDPLSLSAMEALSRETYKISRIDYLLTQFKVLWIYIRLFFIPRGFHLDWEVSLAKSLMAPGVAMALAGHVALLASAVALRRRFPAMAFGVLFFYLAQAVESGFIPIRDVCFEHRAYLPDLGWCIAVGWAMTIAVSRWKKATWAAVLVTLVGLAALTWQRNAMWRHPVAFWTDNARYSPHKWRVWSELGKCLLQANQPHRAMDALRKAFEVDSQSGHFIVGTTAAVNMLVAMNRLGRYDQGIRLGLQYLKEAKSSLNRSKILTNLGNMYFEIRQFDKAENCYRKAIRLAPQNLASWINLGNLDLAFNRLSEAKQAYQHVLSVDPGNAAAIKGLSVLALRKDHKPKQAGN